MQFNKTHIKLLKLEDEGAEPEIIEGASEILKKTEFVSAYAHGKNPDEDFAESVSYFIVNPDKLISPSEFCSIESAYKRMSDSEKRSFG